MKRKQPLQVQLTTAMRRLGITARAVQSPQIELAGRRLTTSRSLIDGLPWLHFGAATPKQLTERSKDVTLVAALLDRIPVVGIVHNVTGDLINVQLPGWAFAALLRMVATCNQNDVLMALNEFLPLGTAMTPADMRLGRAIASNLEELEQFSPCTSDTE